MTINSLTEALLTEVDAARLLSVSTRTLQAWRVQSEGPPFVKLGRSVRYRRTDLAQWVEANARTQLATSS